MEEVIKIKGGKKLNGTVRIGGSKNATVALIPASILANGPVTICGVPSISDVESLSVLLQDLGVMVDVRSSDSILIDTENMQLIGYEGSSYTLYEDDGIHKDYDKKENYRVLTK